MAGLLSKLQKNPRSAPQPVQEVVLESRSKDASPVFLLDEVVDDVIPLKEVVEAAEVVGQSADILLTEVAPHQRDTKTLKQAPAKSRPSMIIRSKRAKQAELQNAAFADTAPWWMSDSVEKVPQVEALIPSAMALLDVASLDFSNTVELAEAVRTAIRAANAELGGSLRLSRKIQELAENDLLSLLAGKGPLEALYEDQAVTDIFIDSHSSVKVVRMGHAMETPFAFRSPEEYQLFVDCVLQTANRSLTQRLPIVDCVLPDEHRSRVSAIHPSVIEASEPRLCIRVPRLQKIAFFDILQTKTLPAPLAAWLSEVVALGEANILVLGPSGAGKTVMTTALLSSVNSDERIVTIEDVPELFVPTVHLEKLVARPPDEMGQGEVTMKDLLRAALRRSPHRIVVGEIRDEEGRIFLRALETGHAGSIATLHAENSRDALWRLLDLVAAYENAPQKSIMRRLARSVHLTITMKRVEGTPCVTEVSEISSDADGEFSITPLVKYVGLEEGKRRWQLQVDESYWIKRVAAEGVSLMPGLGLKAKSEESSS